MKKYPSIHGGATYVLPIMLSSDGAGIEGDVVATYRVGTETTSRAFAVEDVGIVPDPRTPATAEVYRYDCVIDAATTAAISEGNTNVTLDIDVTISGRVYHVVGAVVEFFAYGGEVENTPQGAHVVLNVAPIVTIVTVLAGNGGGGTITTGDITDMTAAGVALATAADAAAQRFALGAVGYDELPPIEENAGVFVFGTSDVELKPLDNSGLNRAGRTMTIGPGASTGNGAPKSVSITAGQQGASGTAVREPLEVANFKLSAPEFYRPLLLTNRTEGEEEPISTTLVVPENAIAIDTATGKLLTLISGVWTDVSAAHTHLLADGASDVTVTAANLNTLDDGANTTLHYHDADRARANHTGTQPLSSLSQSGATIGQVAQWSGTAWVPATPAGLAIGSAITGATNNRILQSGATGLLEHNSTWYYDNLNFGAAMPTRQTLRTTDGVGAFFASTAGGALIGRVDSGPMIFVGEYAGKGAVIPLNARLGFGDNANDPRTADAQLERHATNVIKGAALRLRDYTVAGLPSASTFIYCTVMCTDESGGAAPVFSDGTNWRRVTDRAIAS